MRFLALFTMWATLVFVPMWFVAKPWQRAIAAAAGAILAWRGVQIEMVDLELFYPFDLGVFIALCLASSWTPWRRRLAAIGFGLPALVLVETAVLCAALGTMLSTMTGHATPAATEAAQRYATSLIRISGLVAAGGAWVLILGRERLSLQARTWLATPEAMPPAESRRESGARSRSPHPRRRP